MTFVALSSLTALIAAAGFFMPDIRDTVFFKPQRERAAAVVLTLAGYEGALRRTKGRFDSFTPQQAATHLKAFGLNTQDWPFEDFLFDARVMPDDRLRLRALPRGESVQDLRVGGQMFVAELTPAGAVGRSGWYP
jgi:hypothetical protein